MVKPKRFDIYKAILSPTLGSEMRKTRPIVVISHDDINSYLRTVIIAPMTTTIKKYPTRIPIIFQGKSGQIALDQIRTIDKTRLVKKLGETTIATQSTIISTLSEMFAK